MDAVWPSILTGLTVAASWASLHRRMNGAGPLAKKMDRVNDRIDLLCERTEDLALRVRSLERKG